MMKSLGGGKGTSTSGGGESEKANGDILGVKDNSVPFVGSTGDVHTK